MSMREIQGSKAKPFKDSGVETFRKLKHADYTVGWICAIPCELTAALAAIDEKHETLPNLPGDINIYSYGTISGHNVVISCLPEGMYGTTAAAVITTRMLAAFQSITVPLMVGVAGGVPSATNDIRLGDVVVSVPTPDCPAVIQYDFGKTVASGKLEHKGSLNKPSIQLLAAASKIRADSSLTENKFPAIINAMLTDNELENFDYPKERDVLHEAGCKHVDELRVCNNCGPVRMIKRKPRPLSKYHIIGSQVVKNRPLPSVHYGPVASGNQVMKNSRIRDEIANPLGILCFEMESAGLMDTFPCLVIRGICDYCDARKQKKFQKYSSIVASAYAKLILTIIPPQDPKRLMAAKDHFDAVGIAPRMMAIRNASPNTCTWLSQHPVYSEWLNDDKLEDNHGILWIKGKPGAGKSTLMNFTRKQLEEKHTLITFFFNARGTEVEKSTSGMYRSLLSQLFKAFPALQMQLDLSSLPSLSEHWSLFLLQRLFVATIVELGRQQQQIFCLIDALDESVEDDIRDMVEVFKELGELTASGAIQFRVLWSSRYYPYISINFGLEIQLNKVEGHSKDLQRYIHRELPSDGSRLLRQVKAEILSKSAGIFLWVVLVIQLLRKEYDHGRIHAMRKTLADLPEKLSDLFRDIIFRDMVNIDGLIVCLRWVLYCDEPLEGIQLYSAMMIELEDVVISETDSHRVTCKNSARYLTSSSKGLVELVHSISHDSVIGCRHSETRIQFIHESVREYLLREDNLQALGPSFESLGGGKSHEKLATCCINYLACIRPQVESKWEHICLETIWEYPFIWYAMPGVFRHAEEASKFGFSWDVSIYQDIYDYWNEVEWLRQAIPGLTHRSKAENNLLGYLATRNLSTLLQICLPQPGDQPCDMIKFFDEPLKHAMYHRSFEAMQVLLSTGSVKFSMDDLNELCGIYSDRMARRPLDYFHIPWMASYGPTRLVTILLDSEAWLSRYHPGDVIFLAAASGNVKVFDQMLARLKLSEHELQTALSLAARNQNSGMIRRLVSLGALVTPSHLLHIEETALVHAVNNGQIESIKFLLSLGVKTDRLSYASGDTYNAWQSVAKKIRREVTNSSIHAGLSLGSFETKTPSPHRTAVRIGDTETLENWDQTANVRNSSQRSEKKSSTKTISSLVPWAQSHHGRSHPWRSVFSRVPKGDSL